MKTRDEAEAAAAFYERTGQIDAAYSKQDPTQWKPLVLVHEDGRVIGREQPPKWFARKVAAAQCPASQPRMQRPVARSRERRAHRTSRTRRAGPDDDSGEPEPASDALTFAAHLLDHLKAFDAVLRSEFRDLHSLSAVTYDLLNREVAAMREAVGLFLETERVAEAVADA
ncbi:MAG TPA: hypothetical protein VK506_09960 [Conexibacter sp.]|nr:hypothetical protein [Conexibacter sp.]